MEAELLTSEFDASRSTLRIAGDIDEVSGPAMREAIDRYSEGFTSDLVVDLSGVDFLPSLGVGVLAVALKTARQRGTSLELVAQDGSVAQRVLQICVLPYRTA